MKEIWTPKKRLSSLPNFPRSSFIQDAEILYEDLLNNPLKVVLIPAPIKKHQNHMIRFVESHNPYWYPEIYYSHNRGKRKLFEKSLWRIVNLSDEDFNQKNNMYNYDTSFRGIIYSRLVEGYIDSGGFKDIS